MTLNGEMAFILRYFTANSVDSGARIAWKWLKLFVCDKNVAQAYGAR